MTKYKRLTKEDKTKMIKLKVVGYNNKEIAHVIGCSTSAITYHFKQMRDKIEKHEIDVENMFWTVIANTLNVDVLRLMRVIKLYL